ncbi:hypothetical protein KXV50_006667, partial [Aspergillus fumigatus]
NLGQGPDTDESCCFICGYYDFNPPDNVAPSSTYCQDEALRFDFECPRTDVPSDGVITPKLHTAGAYDDNGNYSEWGHAFVWTVTVDLAASQAAQAAQAAAAPNTDPGSQAGCLMAGNITFPNADGEIGGTPICNDNTVGDTPTFVLCFLNRIKPAHTVLN